MFINLTYNVSFSTKQREKTSQAFRDALHSHYKSSSTSKKERRAANRSTKQHDQYTPHFVGSSQTKHALSPIHSSVSPKYLENQQNQTLNDIKLSCTSENTNIVNEKQDNISNISHELSIQINLMDSFICFTHGNQFCNSPTRKDSKTSPTSRLGFGSDSQQNSICFEFESHHKKTNFNGEFGYFPELQVHQAMMEAIPSASFLCGDFLLAEYDETDHDHEDRQLLSIE